MVITTASKESNYCRLVAANNGSQWDSREGYVCPLLWTQITFLKNIWKVATRCCSISVVPERGDLRLRFSKVIYTVTSMVSGTANTDRGEKHFVSVMDPNTVNTVPIICLWCLPVTTFQRKIKSASSIWTQSVLSSHYHAFFFSTGHNEFAQNNALIPQRWLWNKATVWLC